MVKCTCGRVMEKVPSWLAEAKVEFVCNNCPNRQTKNIAFVDLTPVTGPKAPEDVVGMIDEPIEEDEE